LINAPMSVLRAVMTPSKVATTAESIPAREARHVGRARPQSAFFAAAAPAFSSASCFDTDSVSSSSFPAALVVFEGLRGPAWRDPRSTGRVADRLPAVDFGQQLAFLTTLPMSVNTS